MEQRLRHVYWIGGGSRAGKSTIAKRLVAERGWQLYSTDASMAEHTRRSTPEKHPLLAKFMAMNMDERWVRRSPQAMFETFPWFHGECFEMILEDLVSLPSDSPIIVEGFRLLPAFVGPVLSEDSRAIWLLPTPRLRRHISETTDGSEWAFLSKTSNREGALNNLRARDALFTEDLAEEIKRLDLSAIEIDIGTSENDVFERVKRTFKL